MGPLGIGRLKPLVPFGSTCRLIDFSLANAARSGIDEVVLLSQYSEKQLMDDLRRTWWRPGFRVHFGPWDRAYAEGIPTALPKLNSEPERGTADAFIRKAPYLFGADVREILVQHADHVYRYDYREMIARHRQTGAAATLAFQQIERRYVHLFGMVEFDARGDLVRFEEKPTVVTSDLVFAAFCLFDATVLHRYLEQLDGTDWQHDISRDVIPAMLAGGERIIGQPVHGYWADIGTVDRYLDAHLAMTGPHRSSGPRLEDLPVTIDPGISRHYVEQAGTVHTSIVAANVRAAGGLRSSVAFPDVRVGADAMVTESVLLPGAQVPPGARLHRCIVLEDGTVQPVGPDSLVEQWAAPVGAAGPMSWAGE